MHSKQLTELINTHGDELSHEQQRALETVYDQLKKIAKSQRYKVHHAELNTTALVNEAWIKMKKKEPVFNDRNHFYATSAIAMRHILLNQATKLSSQPSHVTLHNADLIDDLSEAHWLIEMEKQLKRMGRYSKRLENIFVCRYFGGMKISEIAELFDTSPRTIDREWKKAKLMMSASMSE